MLNYFSKIGLASSSFLHTGINDITFKKFLNKKDFEVIYIDKP